MKVEYLYTGLLVLAFIAVAWLSVYAVYRLYRK